VNKKKKRKKARVKDEGELETRSPAPSQFVGISYQAQKTTSGSPRIKVLCLIGHFEKLELTLTLHISFMVVVVGGVCDDLLQPVLLDQL